MKHVSPRVDLPMVHIPPFSSTVPPRTACFATRNMTGIYLGTDDAHSYPRPRHAVPPLARGRGMSRRPRTPTEDRRYKKVELLRYKEERRGFSGNAVRRKQLQTEPELLSAKANRLQRQSSQDTDIVFCDVSRQTQRHFTAATNSGVTHLEYLNADLDLSLDPSDRSTFTAPLQGATVAQEVHRLASSHNNQVRGLVDCYKKVCKGNVEALQTLLPSKPQRKSACTSRGRSARDTGFTVKSYRNPNQVEYDAEFSDHADSARPRTAIGGIQSGSPRLYVPSPYIFKSFSHSHAWPQRSVSGPTSAPAFEDGAAPYTRFTCLPRSDPRRRHNTTPLPTPLATTEVLQGSSYTNPRGPPQAVPRGPPAQNSARSTAASTVDSASAHGLPTSAMNLAEPEPAKVSISVPGTAEEDILGSSVDGSSELSERRPSVADIVIGLEDEQGEQKPVEIDVADEAVDEDKADQTTDPEYHQSKRRMSITERVLKNKNCEQQMQLITEDAESRKMELAELLSEHAQIVREVVTMVQSAGTPSSDKENKTFSSPPSSPGD